MGLMLSGRTCVGQEKFSQGRLSRCLALLPRVIAFAFASHSYDNFHLLMPLFVCRRWRGTPQAQEGQTLAWVHANKLGDYAMPEADRPLVPLLRDFL